jgi:hypothetical protein
VRCATTGLRAGHEPGGNGTTEILRFGSTRADVGVDLYNLFNSSDTTTFDANFAYATNGATAEPDVDCVAAICSGST